MAEPGKVVLVAMALLLIKHCIADFYLQTPYQVQNKGKYLHPGGLLHSFIHTIMTLPVFAVLPPESWASGAAILAAEYLIHYHVDWTKDKVNRLTNWTPTQSPFWWALGTDQLAHGLTYVAIVWALLTPGLLASAMSLAGQ